MTLKGDCISATIVADDSVLSLVEVEGWSRVSFWKCSEGRNLSFGIIKGLNGNIPVHWKPFTAFPTVAPLLHAVAKILPKLNLLIALLGFECMKFVAS